MPITKIDAARRQLDAAIELFFARGDAIAVATLAYNALEISSTLARRQDGRDWTLFEEVAREHNSTLRDVRDIFHGPRNFFKHADRDPDATIADFDEKDADHLLALTVLQFGEVAARSVEMWSLLIWFYAVHGDYEVPEAMQPIVVDFSYLATLDRAGQLAERPRVLAELRRRAK